MAETGLNQNWFRDYDPLIGKYVESDPIGLEGGNNTYTYGLDNPVGYIDTTGLDVQFCCRLVKFPLLVLFGFHHCYFNVNGVTYGLYPLLGWDIGLLGVPLAGKDGGGKCKPCTGKAPCSDPAKCVVDAANSYPVGRYGGFFPNSNTFAGTIAGKCCGNTPGDGVNAPGIDGSPPPGFGPRVPLR